MGFLDRAKEVAQRAKTQVRDARDQGQQRLEDLQARREAEVLLREVGLAAFDEHRGDGSREAVVRALAALDQHLGTHPVDLGTGGLRGYLKAASGAEATEPGEAETGETSEAGTDADGGDQTDGGDQADTEAASPAAQAPVPDPDAPTPPADDTTPDDTTPDDARAGEASDPAPADPAADPAAGGTAGRERPDTLPEP